MFKKLFFTALLIAALPVLCSAAITKEEILDYMNWQELTNSFSADHTITSISAAGTVTRKSKIDKRGTDFMRIETEPAILKALPKTRKPLGSLVLIKNLAQKKAYFVFPARKAYVEADSDQLKRMMENLAGQLQQNADLKKPEIKGFKKEGTEKIGDINCDKVHGTIRLKNDGKSDITAWIAPKYNNFPVKSIIETTMPNGNLVSQTAQFENIKRLPPAESLFRVPADYTKYQNLVQLATEGKAGEQMKKNRARRQQNRRKRRK